MRGAGNGVVPWSSIAPYAAAVAVLMLAAAVPLVIQQGFLLYMLSLSMIGAIIATGLNVTNGYLGILNLSVGGQVALGSYVCALVAQRGVPVPIAIGLAALAGAGLAAVTFLLLGRLAGFFFGLATIAAAEVVRLLIRNLDTITHGMRGVRGYPPLAATPSTTYWSLLAAMVLLLLLLGLLARSSLGLRWKAIRENAGKALSLGLPVWRLQLAGYVLAGTIMSFGGALLALLLQYIEPGIAGLNTLVQAVLMVALGGAGTIMGPVVGALAITLIPEFLRLANELRLVIYGVTLIVVVLALPGGVVGAFNRSVRERRLAVMRANKGVE
jgi:branched-chain amino acid transport system permease protein